MKEGKDHEWSTGSNNEKRMKSQCIILRPVDEWPEPLDEDEKEPLPRIPRCEPEVKLKGFVVLCVVFLPSE